MDHPIQDGTGDDRIGEHLAQESKLLLFVTMMLARS